jgi:type I restriction enzyme R subunit
VGKEARARIKINKLLEESGWRFFDSPEGSAGSACRANILLENNVKLTEAAINEFGEDHVDAALLGERDPRELERRLLLDTYKTFGCETIDGGTPAPTFRYSLLDGVKDGYLVNPIVADARTKITTRLLSAQGYSAVFRNDEDQNEEDAETIEELFVYQDFEKSSFPKIPTKLFAGFSWKMPW